MPIHVSDSQLDRIERGREPAVLVRSARTKREYAVITHDAYAQLRPLLQCVAPTVEAPVRGNGHTAEWTDEKNARRLELINKKHNEGLTTAEKKELASLVAEATRFRDRTAPVRTEILELILAGLKQQTSKKAKR